MTKRLLLFWLLGVLAAPREASPRVEVRDHRGPGAAAQWKIGREVDSQTLHRLYNTERGKHLVANRSSGKLLWQDKPGVGDVIFENCTRPGELVYSSDRVGVRFGTRFLVYAAGNNSRLDWTQQRERGCEFRLIPSATGFVAAGSGDGTFAIYNIRVNRYLVSGAGSPGLRWQETASGKPPSAVSARADFVPVELFFTTGTVGDRKVQTAYLTIQNVGNVPSSASQREMKVRIRGEEKDFLVIQPVAPGAILRNPLALNALLAHCEHVTVELDTNPTLKFQVGQGAFPNDDVFANDRKILTARDRHPAHPQKGAGVLGAGTVVDCDPPPIK